MTWIDETVLIRSVYQIEDLFGPISRFIVNMILEKPSLMLLVLFQTFGLHVEKLEAHLVVECRLVLVNCQCFIVFEPETFLFSLSY